MADCNNCQGESCGPCNNPQNMACKGCGRCAYCRDRGIRPAPKATK